MANSGRFGTDTEGSRRSFAVITGASRGIGEQYAYALADLNHDVLLVARDKVNLERVAIEITRLKPVDVMLEVLDLAEPDAAVRLFAAARRYRDRIDLLVHNAGIGYYGSFADMPMAEVQRMLRLHINTVAESTRLFLPDMVARGSGTIITVASVSGLSANAWAAEYSATKAFLIAFFEALAMEVRSQGVYVQVCCPGPTDTDHHGPADNPVRRRGQSPKQVVQKSLAALADRRILVATDWKSSLQLIIFRTIPQRLWQVVQALYHVLKRAF